MSSVAGGSKGAWRRVAPQAALVAMLCGVVGCGGESPDSSPDGAAAASASAGISEPTEPAQTESTTPDASIVSDTATKGASTPDDGVEPGPPMVPPVSIKEEADFGDGVTATVVKLAAVDAEAAGAGEIGGPAVAVTIALRNGTSKTLPLGAVNVQMVYGSEQTPATPVDGDPQAKDFTGSLDPKDRQKGVYLFTIPPDERDEVTITVSHASLSPIVAFQGVAPR